MKVLLNGLQAGNRSGTGRYVAGLVSGLLQLPDPAPDVQVVWPAETDPPEALRDAPLLRRPGAAGRRVLFDQMGVHALRGAIGAQVVHFPANFGPLRPCRGLVVTVHDLGFLRHPEWFRADRALYYRYLARKTLRHAARIVADSASTADDLSALLGIPEDRIAVVPLAADPAFRPVDEDAQARVRHRLALPERFFLYVGTVEPRKNLPRLIAAWDQVADRIPQHLVIAGRAGWKTRGIAAAAGRARHRDRLHFPGYVAEADLPALLCAAEALAWPSLFEGFGLPPLEALACGTPVLTGGNSSLPEVTGDAALLVDAASERAIAEGLEALGRDDALRARLAEKGPLRAAEFSWLRTATETAAAYRAAGEY